MLTLNETNYNEPCNYKDERIIGFCNNGPKSGLETTINAMIGYIYNTDSTLLMKI